MRDTLQLREIAVAMRRLWWIPAILAITGLGVGVLTSSELPAIYRSQATLLVGPTDGAVTQTSTVRTSEDLANFYADLARRQLTLEPVTQRLALDDSWAELRNKVSAVVPRENLRLVTVTVMGDTQTQADDVANALVRQLVSLSPALPGGNSQAFINEQADNLKQTIQDTQERIDSLEAEAASPAVDPGRKRDVLSEADKSQETLIELQRVYVELIAAEPTADAGGLSILDEASAVTDQGRSGEVRQGLIGAVLGGAVGMIVAWLLYRLLYRRGKEADADQGPRPSVTPPDASSEGSRRSAAARQANDGVRDAVSSKHSYASGSRRRGRAARV